MADYGLEQFGYVSENCRDAGIKHPVGMCFQDAGWKNGPWLGSGKNIKTTPYM